MNKSKQTDIPLVFFSIAFFIILLGLFSKLSFQKGAIPNTVLQKAVVTPVSKNTEMKLKSLNYEAPISCWFVNAEASISAQIDRNSIAMTIQQKGAVTKMILLGDCLYTWEITELVGKKQCGVGQYIGIGKQILGSGFVSSDSLGSMAEQMGKNFPVDIGKLINSCDNVKKVNDENFILPKGINFD